MQLEKELFNLLRKIQDSDLPTKPRPSEFRVSALPFCPLLWVMDAKNPKTSVAFNSSFYFAIGNSLHTLWQDASASVLSKQVIGDYKCKKNLKVKETQDKIIFTQCNRIVRFTTMHEAQKVPCLHGFSQQECAAAQRYEELQLKYGLLSGHTDLLIKIKGKIHLLDFKNTSNFLFDKPEIAKNYNYPNPKYVHQQETYVVLLEKQYKIKIDSYSIVYISRERATHAKGKPALKLFTVKVTNKIRNAQRAKIKNYQYQHKIAKTWLDKKSKIYTNKLWDARPCLTMKDYLVKMKPTFYGDCEQLEPCRSGDLKDTLRKLAVK